jgi:hypothetical protein
MVLTKPWMRDFMTKGKEIKRMQQITIKLKVDDLDKLRDYADKKGGNPVSHYIREAVSEYLENHYKD